MMMMTVMITARPDTVLSKRGSFRGKLAILVTCMYMWSDMSLSMSHKSPQSPAHFLIFIVRLFLQKPFSYRPYSFLKMKKKFSPCLFFTQFLKMFSPRPWIFFLFLESEFLFIFWRLVQIIPCWWRLGLRGPLDTLRAPASLETATSLRVGAVF